MKKSTVPKIIIKPRLIAAASRTPASTEPESPAITQGDDEQSGSNSNVEVIDSQAMDVDVASVADDGSQLLDENGTAYDTPTRRPRGRPRGRGKTAGTVTPRARGRGRGRARGRARGGLTIRLPRRGDDDAETGAEGDVEGEGYGEIQDGEGATPVDTGEVPFGGGKPVRTIQGKNYIIDGDEYVTEEDPKGNEKIDEWGNLLGDRRFKANTFVLPNRHPHRVYMLAIDAARTSGFRDSLYYFRRNPLAFKLNATQPEKEYLIGEGKLGSHLKTRSVTLVTARSAFKLHGSKMVIDGKWVVDDYYEEKVTAEIAERGLKPGDPVGELPDPNAPKETAATATDAAAIGSKGERGGGGGGIYRPGGPTTVFGTSGWGPYSDGPLNAVRKSLLTRDGVSEENWMLMMAMRVAEADDEWSQLRRENMKVVQGVDDLAMGLQGGGMLPNSAKEQVVDKGKRRKRYEEEEEEEEDDNAEDTKPPSIVSLKSKKRKATFKEDANPAGVYEPHTHIAHYRSDTQPTRSRWEQLPGSGSKRCVLGGTKAGNGAWALAWVDTVMEFPKPDDPPSAEAMAREKLLHEAASLEHLTESAVNLTSSV